MAGFVVTEQMKAAAAPAGLTGAIARIASVLRMDQTLRILC